MLQRATPVPGRAEPRSPAMPTGTLTPRQQQWFAAVREGLTVETGRSVDQWADIARTCPETAHRARLAWLKAHHGLGQNRASIVLAAAFPADAPWTAETANEQALWKDAAGRAVLDAVRGRVDTLADVVTGQRKGFTAWSRNVQFAALRPAKGGVRLGLAVPVDTDPRLVAPTREGWSERLTGVLVLPGPDTVDDGVAALLQQAWARS